MQSPQPTEKNSQFASKERIIENLPYNYVSFTSKGAVLLAGVVKFEGSLLGHWAFGVVFNENIESGRWRLRWVYGGLSRARTSSKAHI